MPTGIIRVERVLGYGMVDQDLIQRLLAEDLNRKLLEVFDEYTGKLITVIKSGMQYREPQRLVEGWAEMRALVMLTEMADANLGDYVIESAIPVESRVVTLRPSLDEPNEVFVERRRFEEVRVKWFYRYPERELRLWKRVG
jgi:hypothetical protein